MIKKNKCFQIRFFSIHTILSLFLSFLFVWGVGYFFCDSLSSFQFDPELQRYVHQPAVEHKNRSEGYARTYKGKFGINAIEDITKDKRGKIVIWGDSYIEAHQVNDKDKMSQLISEKLLKIGLGEQLMSFSVGMSGESLADYYFNIPKYEKLTNHTILSHYILITDINDTLPDQQTDQRRGIFKSKPFQIYHDGWIPKYQKIKNIINHTGLYCIWRPIVEGYAKLKNIKLQFYKKYNETDKSTGRKVEVYSDQFLIDSWTFLFGKLRNQTELPIVIIYAPLTPYIDEGRIHFENGFDGKISMLTDTAKENNISVVDVTEMLNDFYRINGLFPRGFSNSEPSYGHFNESGNEIVGNVIFNEINSMLSH